MQTKLYKRFLLLLTFLSIGLIVFIPSINIPLKRETYSITTSNTGSSLKYYQPIDTSQYQDQHQPEEFDKDVLDLDVDDLSEETYSEELAEYKANTHTIPHPHKAETTKEIDNIEEIRKSVRNIPSAPYILGSDYPPNGLNSPKFLGFDKTCARFPTLYNIHFSNLYWQVERIQNISFYLYSAYFDTRELNPFAPEVRILAMLEQSGMNCSGDVFCQLWFKDEKSPTIIKVRECNPMWYSKWDKGGLYTGFILSCPVPKSHSNKVPNSVSIVQDKCSNATNNLKIHYNNPKANLNLMEDPIDPNQNNLRDALEAPITPKSKFGVCVKALDLLEEGDKPARLAEWIELLGLLGVDKIFFYEFSVHPNIKKLLNYYESKGKIQVTPLTLPGLLPNEPKLRHQFLGHKFHITDKRKNELMPYNDCIYRNMYEYDYLSVLDTDEVIIPILETHTKWNDLTSNPETQILKNGKEVSTFCFRNSYFFDDAKEGSFNQKEEDYLELAKIPQHFHMLRHVYRSKNHTKPKEFIKCIHKSDRTILVHNHLPLACLGGGKGYGNCSVFHFQPEIAHMQHYRSTCVEELSKYCSALKNNSILDSSIWKYKDELIKRVDLALNQIKLFN